MNENRSSRKLTADIRPLRLKKEEQDVLLELEHGQVIKKKEIEAMGRLLDRAGAGPHEEVSVVVAAVKKLRADMKPLWTA